MYPDTRNARSTCALGAMIAEYVVDSAPLEASTVTSRTAFGVRASVSVAARPAHPHVWTAATATKTRTVRKCRMFMGPCPWPFQNRLAPSRDPSMPAYSDDSLPQDSIGVWRPR